MRLYPQLAAPRNRQITRDVLVGLALLLFALFAWAVHSAVMSLTAISEGFTGNAQGAADAWNSVGGALSGIPLLGDELQGAVQDLSDATFGTAAQTGQSVTDAVTLAARVLAFVTFAAPAAVVLVLWLPRRLDRARAWDAAERVLSAIAVSPQFGLVAGHGLVAGSGTPELTDRSGSDPDVVHDTVALPSASGQNAALMPGPAAGAPAGATAGAPAGAPAGASGGLDRSDHVVSFPPDELLALRALSHLPFADLVLFTPRPFEAFAAGDYAPLVAALYAHEGLNPPGWSVRS
jgi:hypothetical protein